MFSLICKLSLTMAAVMALAILTASFPASSYERVVNLGQQQQQRALPHKAIDGLKNGHDRFATKVDPPQEPERTKMITR